uniref:HIT domain-containing protein n=1 Tax=Zea mays TaxID=4577 RepID=A0A804RJX1_MAIZE
MRKTFCFGGRRVARKMSERAPMVDGCVFCEIVRGAPASTTALLYSDDKVVAFRDINPSAFRHYLVIPIDHIPTVNSLRKTKDDHQLVSHMVKVGKDFLNQDAPNSEEHRFGFHQPPFNSIDHLHLHCLALPFIPR